MEDDFEEVEAPPKKTPAKKPPAKKARRHNGSDGWMSVAVVVGEAGATSLN